MKRVLLIFSFLLSLNSMANVYNFQSSGDIKADEILKHFIQNQTEEYDYSCCAFFCDINNDSKNEVIGIIKSGKFHNLRGYKLIVLKNEKGQWNSIKSDIYFNPDKKFEVLNKKIAYYSSAFYDNKKYSAKYKKGQIKTSKSFLSYFKNKKAENIEKITEFKSNETKNEMTVYDFHPSKQRNVNITYSNLSNRTKHYLEFK